MGNMADRNRERAALRRMRAGLPLRPRKARNAFERIMWAAAASKGIRLSAYEVAWMSTFPGLQEMARVQDMPTEDEAEHSCFTARGGVDTFRCGGDGWHRCVECACFDGGLKSAGTETP